MTAELSGELKRVYDAMVKIGATDVEKAKTMENIAKEAKLPKGAVGNIMEKLIKNKVVKRKTGKKTASYYILASGR